METHLVISFCGGRQPVVGHTEAVREAPAARNPYPLHHRSAAWPQEERRTRDRVYEHKIVEINHANGVLSVQRHNYLSRTGIFGGEMRLFLSS